MFEAAEILRKQFEDILEDEGSLVFLKALTFCSCFETVLKLHFREMSYICVDFDSQLRYSPHFGPIYFQLQQIRLNGWRWWYDLKDFHLSLARC